MPLSKEQDNEITRQHWRAIAGYLGTFTWEWVLSLTLSDFPGTLKPRVSAKRFAEGLYPKFLSRLQEKLGMPVQDFWALERGKVKGRPNMHVLLTLKAPVTEAYLQAAWRTVASSDALVKEYEPDKGAYYWMKDLVRSEADIIDYGGSVILLGEIPSSPKPKFRKSHYREHGPVPKSRPQPGAVIEQSLLPDQPSSFRMSQQMIDRLNHARRIREQQGIK